MTGESSPWQNRIFTRRSHNPGEVGTRTSFILRLFPRNAQGIAVFSAKVYLLGMDVSDIPLCGDDFAPELADDGPSLDKSFDSPYRNSLFGRDYVIDHGTDSDSGVFGMCPLCNNARHKEIDALAASGGFAALRKMGFTKSEIDRHLGAHIGLVYAAVGRGMVGTGESGQRVYGLGRIVEDPMMPDTVAVDPSASYPLPRKYAFDGGKQVLPLRPWNHIRGAAELKERAVEAINFYDEMMEIRGMARRVYSEIMDPDPVANPDGTYSEPKKNMEYFSVAVSAIKEMSRVVDTLGKMSLIAKRLGEGGPEKQLDPGLQSIVDSIGTRGRKAIEAAALDAPPLAAEIAAEVHTLEASAAAAHREATSMRTVEAMDPIEALR